MLHVTGTTATRISRNILLLARADADLDDTERLHAIASGRIATPVRSNPGPGGPQVTDSLVGRVARAARLAQMADAGKLDPQHARALAQDLTEALAALQRLRDRPSSGDAKRTSRMAERRYTSADSLLLCAQKAMGCCPCDQSPPSQ